jgi:endo-1,4-beta-D-glucanase Y
MKTIGYVSLGIILAILIVAFYRYRNSATGPLVFSPTQVLSSSWYVYKKLYVDPSSFRTIDHARGDVTTSEGQSYTMLRAVWQGDETTFDGAWGWTKQHLSRSADHLFSWIWGTRPDGTTGVLITQSGQNSASDADTDIALALVFAYARWQDPNYLKEARATISDIWDKEVITIQGKPYLAADNVEKSTNATSIVVNPSYLSPAAYHIFASVDPAHPWEQLRANSYALLATSAKLALGEAKSDGLPPDWVAIDKTNGAMQAVPSENADTSFGFDALRVPFRVALDATWFQNPQATDLLRSFSFLSSAWNADGQLAASYAHDGSPALTTESAAMYGGTLGYFLASDPEMASTIYREKLLSLYDATTGGWSPTLSYYDDNWAWFGIALYNGQLPNLTARLPRTAFIE